MSTASVCCCARLPRRRQRCLTSQSLRMNSFHSLHSSRPRAQTRSKARSGSGSWNRQQGAAKVAFIHKYKGLTWWRHTCLTHL